MDRWMHPHKSDVIIHPSVNLTENICVKETLVSLNIDSVNTTLFSLLNDV